jgi:SSS family solute:Na+ symporter
MGRKLTLPLFVATLVSSWYGGVFGVTQIAFEHGIYNFITQGVFWYLAYIIFAIFFVKKVHKTKALTFPEMIGQMFGNSASKLSAVILIGKSLPITYAISIGVLIQSLFGISMSFGIVIGTLFVTLYTCFGNFRTVVYSDFFQFILMYLSVILVVIFAYNNIGGLKVLHEMLPPHYFKPSGKHEFNTMFLWLFIAITTTLISPVFYQRCIAAKNVAVARWGIIISTIFWLIFDLCTTLGGMYAKVYLPGANSISAYLYFGVDILPSPLKGVFLAGMMATLISTLDTFMFVSSGMLSHDLVPKKYRDHTNVRIVSVLIIGLLSMIVALLYEGTLEKLWITIEGYIGAMLIVPIILGLFFKQKSSSISFAVIVGISLIAMIVKDVYFQSKVESFYIGTLAALIAYLLNIAKNKAFKLRISRD